jgi:hypothetical protein
VLSFVLEAIYTRRVRRFIADSASSAGAA